MSKNQGLLLYQLFNFTFSVVSCSQPMTLQLSFIIEMRNGLQTVLIPRGDKP